MKTYRIFYLYLVALHLFASASVHAQHLNEVQIDGLKILVEELENGNLEFNFQFEEKSHTIQALLVENPTRIVFDIPGYALKGGKNIPLHSQIVKQVRIGVHKEKVRLVFDANTNTLKHIKKIDSDGLKYTVSSQSESSAAVENTKTPEPEEKSEHVTKPIDNAPQESTPLPTPQESIKSEEKIIETVKATPTESLVKVEKTPETIPSPVPPSATPTPVPSSNIKDIEDKAKEIQKDKTDLQKSNLSDNKDVESPSPVKNSLDVSNSMKVETLPSTTLVPVPEENESIKDVEKKLQPTIVEKSNGLNTKTEEEASNDTVIKSIVFQTTAEKMQSSMVISSSQAVSYTIHQISKSEYELVIPNTKLKGEHLKLPQYPPDSFKGFLYFTASDDASGTRIKIQVEDGIILTPYLANGKLWVKAE